MDGILTRLMYIARTVLGSLRDPTSNLTVAFLAMAIIALLLILLLLVIYFLVALRDWEAEERKRESARVEVDPSATGRRRRAAALIVGGMLLLTLAGSVTFSATDSACRRCHYTDRAFESRTKSVHASVSCAACHISGSPSGRMLALTRGASNLVEGLGTRKGGPVDAAVGDGACLRCHARVKDATIVAQGIRIRHKEILESGRSCDECHNTVGHGDKVRRPRYPGMGSCLPCHDGSAASSACETCHVEDTGVALRRLPRGFKTASLVRDDCRGCHSLEKCNECHGLELPHSREFVSGYHARPALVEKETCLKCHDLYAFCNKGCHHFKAGLAEGTRVIRGQHDDPDFVTWHRRYDADRCAGCHSDPDVCRYCHER